MSRGCIRHRNKRGAHPIPVRDRRQPQNVGSQQPFERQGLGLAQLGELLGDMGDRAVVLADLDGAALASYRGSRVSLLGEHGHQRIDPIADIGDRVEITPVVLGPAISAVPRELRDPVGTAVTAAGVRKIIRGVRFTGSILTGGIIHRSGFGEEAQGAQCQVVVGEIEGMRPTVGEREDASGSTPTPLRGRTERGTIRRGDQPLFHQGIEVSTDDSAAETQALCQGCGCRRTAVVQSTGDPFGTGAREFHTPSVSLIAASATSGDASPTA